MLTLTPALLVTSSCSLEGHDPLLHTNADGSKAAADASYYRAQLLNTSYVWSDQAGRPLDPGTWKKLSNRVNHTLLAFFGYHWPRVQPSL